MNVRRDLAWEKFCTPKSSGTINVEQICWLSWVSKWLQVRLFRKRLIQKKLKYSLVAAQREVYLNHPFEVVYYFALTHPPKLGRQSCRLFLAASNQSRNVLMISLNGHVWDKSSEKWSHQSKAQSANPFTSKVNHRQWTWLRYVINYEWRMRNVTLLRMIKRKKLVHDEHAQEKSICALKSINVWALTCRFWRVYIDCLVECGFTFFGLDTTTAGR